MHISRTAIVGITLGVLLPVLATAQAVNPCPLGSLACPGAGADAYFASILTSGARIAFGGVLFAMLIWYGLKLIIGADNDSTITESYHAYSHAMIGTILAGGAFTLASTFAVPGQLINQAPGNSIVNGVINTIRGLLFAALIFNMFYQGYRLVSDQDESQAEKAKKQFIYGMVGAGIVILADRVVLGIAGVDTGILSREVVGIANFLGTILGAFSVIALFIAGMWLVFAVNEQNKDKAKKIITTAFVVLAVTMMSLALIRLTISAPTAP